VITHVVRSCDHTQSREITHKVAKPGKRWKPKRKSMQRGLSAQATVTTDKTPSEQFIIVLPDRYKNRQFLNTMVTFSS